MIIIIILLMMMMILIIILVMRMMIVMIITIIILSKIKNSSCIKHFMQLQYLSWNCSGIFFQFVQWRKGWRGYSAIHLISKWTFSCNSKKGVRYEKKEAERERIFRLKKNGMNNNRVPWISDTVARQSESVTQTFRSANHIKVMPIKECQFSTGCLCHRERVPVGAS